MIAITPPHPYAGFTAWATAAGALATFVAAGVALLVAVTGSKREDKRRAAERNDVIKTFKLAIVLTLQQIMAIYEENDKHLKGSVRRKGLLTMLYGARSSVEYALRLQVSELDLISAALNIQKQLLLMIGDAESYVPPVDGQDSIPVAQLQEWFAPLRKGFAVGLAGLTEPPTDE